MKAVKERNRQKITKRGIEIDRKFIHYFGYERRIVGSKYTFKNSALIFEPFPPTREKWQGETLATFIRWAALIVINKSAQYNTF